jgi:hypothetical protein
MGISNVSNGLRSGVCTSTTRPTAPYEGQVIYETDTDRVLVWNASAWVMPNQSTTNPPALELVKTQTIGSNVSSVTVSDAFSADYDAYKILLNGICSANGSVSIKLGSSVTGYYGFLVYGESTSNTVYGVGRNNQPDFPYVGGGTAGNLVSASVEVISPFAATYTRFANGIYQDNVSFGTMQGEHKVAASYTSFILTPGAGTFTSGTIRVYGYKK